MPLDDPRVPTLHGKYKRAALRRQGRGRRVFAAEAAPTSYLVDARSTGTTSSTSAWVRGAARTASSCSPAARRRARSPGSRSADIGACAYGVFRRGTGGGRPALRNLRRDPRPARRWRRLSRSISGAGELHRRAVRGLRRLGFPGADDLGNMFQVQATLLARVPGDARSASWRARSIRACTTSTPGSARTSRGFRSRRPRRFLRARCVGVAAGFPPLGPAASGSLLGLRRFGPAASQSPLVSLRLVGTPVDLIFFLRKGPPATALRESNVAWDSATKG